MCSHAHDYPIFTSGLDVATEFQGVDSPAPQAPEVQDVNWLNTLSSPPTSPLSSLLHLHGAPQHRPLAQARSLRVIVDLILSKSTNLQVFEPYAFCFMRTSRISPLLPSSPLNSAMVFVSRIWPPVGPLGAQLPRMHFRDFSMTYGPDFPLSPAHLLGLISLTLCLFLPQQIATVQTFQCHCFQ